MNGTIRAKALCVVSTDDEILVDSHRDPATDERFYRPLGGTVEFGESSERAVVREFREELDVELADLERRGVLENIFTFAGYQCHEYVTIYDGRFENESLYDQDVLEGYEHEVDKEIRATWEPIEDFRGKKGPLYPDGILELLAE